MAEGVCARDLCAAARHDPQAWPAAIDGAAAQRLGQCRSARLEDPRRHDHLKSQAKIELAKVKADLDARLALIDVHQVSDLSLQKTPRSHPPGARKAKDGHQYVADPKRPGKYCWWFIMTEFSLVPVDHQPDFPMHSSFRLSMIRSAQMI